MSYELRAHTADVAVAASGDTLEATVAAVADGLAAASCDEIPDADADAGGSDDDRFTLEVRAESLEALLFEYLDELIYLRDVRLELPVDNRVWTLERVDEGAGDESENAGDENESADDESALEEPASWDGHVDDRWRLAADARGLPLSTIDAREVKAVTYSEMRLEAVDDGWEAYVVFDV